MTPSAVQVALAVVGPVLHAASWLVIRTRRGSIWVVSGVTMGSLGVLALAIGPVRASERFTFPAAAGLGTAAGLLLYGATVAFMAVATRAVAPLSRQTSELYGQRAGRSLPATLGIPVLVSAAGEELLWRGVVLGVLEQSVGSSAVAAVLTWAAFAAVTAASGSLPILLGGVVGGAAWTALAWWTGGVASSIACHAVWTALMIAVPPPGARR